MSVRLKTMNKFWKNQLGYTLVEIVTTTAIIGALTAIAVPNFLRRLDAVRRERLIVPLFSTA